MRKLLEMSQQLLSAMAILPFAFGLLLGAGSSAAAETLKNALARAYQYNSTLNSSRANLRATDEGVAIAKSGFRPTVSGVGSLSYSSNAQGQTRSANYGIQIDQTIFAGFRNVNSVKAAQAQVFAQRQNLLNTGISVLSDTATAYANVYRDRQIVALRSKNLAFLQEQLRSSQARFDVGEATRTDVSLASARLAGARAQLEGAKAALAGSEASYMQLTGAAPQKLSQPEALTSKVPSSLAVAVDMGMASHPAIKALEYAVDAQAFGVKIAEGSFLPGVSARAQAGRTTSSTNGFSSGSNNASVTATLSVPIYQGGRASAQVRQSKEQLGKARIDVEVARENVRAAIARSYAGYQAARASVTANKVAVDANRQALNGLIQERDVGQRTTLDVLNGQASVIDAQVSLVQAQSDLVSASYGVAAATGRLSPSALGLGVKEYDVKQHFKAVEDKWFGLRTPSGQ